jgi:hypothetical protein
LGSRDHFVYYNAMKDPLHTFIIADEVIHSMNIVIYFPKTTCLVKAFNKQLDYLFTGGIINHWSEQYFDTRFLKSAALKDKEPKPLRNEHLLGAYLVFFNFLFYASLTFLLELLSLKFRCLRIIFMKLE